MKKKYHDLENEINRLTQAKNRISDFFNQYTLIFPDNLFSKIDFCHKIDFKNQPERNVAFINSQAVFSTKNFVEKFIELQKMVSEKKMKISGSYMAVFHTEYNGLIENETEFNFDVCISIEDFKKHDKKYLKTTPAGLYITALFNDTDYHKSTNEAIISLKK